MEAQAGLAACASCRFPCSLWAWLGILDVYWKDGMFQNDSKNTGAKLINKSNIYTSV